MDKKEADELFWEAMSYISGAGGSEVKPSEALAIFEKLADNGHSNGMFGLAEMLMVVSERTQRRTCQRTV